ncbi:hypothetical protein J2TS4_29390 [Paenibacillus sp. J2TS4]|nr:hypothetical protein J2TS4_29390 [Paenibacillus sp. J2TS4]
MTLTPHKLCEKDHTFLINIELRGLIFCLTKGSEKMSSYKKQEKKLIILCVVTAFIMLLALVRRLI